MQTERGSLAVTTLGEYIYACGGGKPTAQFETVERCVPPNDIHSISADRVALFLSLICKEWLLQAYVCKFTCYR